MSQPDTPLVRMPMQITVILCTYNRCRSLAKALDSLARQVVPELMEWEVIVVDNNSSDQTREVVADFVRQYPGRFRYLFESQQGHSHARNAGVQAAMGDVLAFMDDDTTVAPNWLQSLTASLHNGKWAGAGGRILPEWICSCPRWLRLDSRHGSAPLALFDLGPKEGELKEPPFGANMAFRKAMFARYGGFRTDLGRQPDSLMSSEESEFGARLLAGGERFRYEPSAIVYHPVSQTRVQKEYFLKWWFHKGRSHIRVSGVRLGTKWCIRGVPLYSFRRLARWMVTWLLAVEESRRFSCKLNVWVQLGEIFECYDQYRSAETTTTGRNAQHNAN
jgi:glycosyltransferase involved in cell wall biosynthesis